MEEKIDVQKIMEEIRAEIKEKGYTPDMLSFDDIKIETARIGSGEYDPLYFEDVISIANEKNQVPVYRVYTGNPAKVFVKKVLRKLEWFFVAPIAEGQNQYNAAVIQAINQIDSYIKKNEKEKEDLRKRIEELEQGKA